MAADSRRQLTLLGGLLVVLVVALWWQFGGGATAPTAASKAARPSAASRAQPAPVDVLAEGVGLERLASHRPAPEEGGRDPFRSGPSAAGPDAGGGSASGAGVARPQVPVAPPVPTGPPPPPPIPPIAVKFIGIVSRQDVGRVAVLSDGKNVYYGRAGEIVDGRWRIVSIGEESLQIEYADGRGRQTVRLSG